MRNLRLSHFKCALCGKQSSISHFDPSTFAMDVQIIQKRGLGYGRGWEDVDMGSIFEGEFPVLLDTIIQRIEALYAAFIQEEEEAEEEEEDDDGAFYDGSQHEKREPPMDAIDYELFLGEQEEDDDELDETTP